MKQRNLDIRLTVMPNLLNKKDAEILLTTADYGLLTVTQLAALTSSSRQMVRRRTRVLARRGFLETTSEGFRGATGRPETVLFLKSDAIPVLRDSKWWVPDLQMPTFDRVFHRSISHTITVNWVRISLFLAAQKFPDLDVVSLSPQFRQDSYRLLLNHSKSGSGPIPDGVFSISHAERENWLLFFLEVDLNTEILTSLRPNAKDIRSKVLNYQKVFADHTYKRYEREFENKFRGFRLLFVANSSSRRIKLSRLVHSINATDFIWLTDVDSILSRGIYASIWYKGGNRELELHSILGPSMATDCPIDIPK